jgi:hypothetical protein
LISTIVIIISISVLFITPLSIFENSYAETSLDSLSSESETNTVRVEMNVTGIPIIFDRPMQALPILVNGTAYVFDIAFKTKTNVSALVENVDYNFIVLINDTEVFNAAKEPIPQAPGTSPSVKAIRAENGTARIEYDFDKTGFARIMIHVLGIDSRTIESESVDFVFDVQDSRKIPEFPLSFLVSSVGIASVIGIMRWKKYKKGRYP